LTGTSIGDLLQAARRRLARAPFAPSTREAALLLGHVLGLTEAAVLARDRDEVDAGARRRFAELLERRLAGEPVAYLLGEREFYGRPFTVDRRVLIPRPETEHLIESALALELPAAPRILDVGAGSGAIAVTLALEVPGARVTATDTSLGALRVAAANAARHGVRDRVATVASDLAAALFLEPFDLVVSNPPYVDPAEREKLSPEVVEFEPGAALFAPDRGRSVIARLLQAASALRPGTHVVIEIGYDQAEWLRSAVTGRRELVVRDVVRDYGGIPRTAVLERVS
jgi:release factor glutamine methyltransferase